MDTMSDLYLGESSYYTRSGSYIAHPLQDTQSYLGDAELWMETYIMGSSLPDINRVSHRYLFANHCLAIEPSQLQRRCRRETQLISENEDRYIYVIARYTHFQYHRRSEVVQSVILSVSG
jgi:hypothetical protein